jgi:hypothetical protein
MEPMMERLDPTTPEEQVVSFEPVDDATLADDITERFRAMCTHGLMNAAERMLALPADKQGAAIVGICQGIANSFAAMLGSVPSDLQMAAAAVLILRVERMIPKHPALTAIGPKVSAAFRKIRDDWELERGEGSGGEPTDPGVF